MTSRLPIPNEILVDIFSLLSFEDINSSFMVCQQFHDVILRNIRKMSKFPVHTLRVSRQHSELSIKFYLDDSETSAAEMIFNEFYVVFLYNSRHKNIRHLYMLSKYFKKNVNCAEKGTKYRHYDCRMIKQLVNNTDDPKILQQAMFLSMVVVDIQNLELENLTRTWYECILKCARAVYPIRRNHRTSVQFHDFTPLCWELCGVLRSPRMQISYYNENPEIMPDVKFLEQVEILVERALLSSIGEYGDLIQQWSSGCCSIKHFEVRNWIFPWELTTATWKEFADKLKNVSGMEVSEKCIQFHLKRDIDDHVLEIEYVNDVTKFTGGEQFVLKERVLQSD